MFTSASLYYLGCTSRNRVTAMVRKLRQPKYIIGLALTVGYFWLIFVANPAFGVGVGSAKGQRENASLIVGGFYVLQVVFTWFALSSGRGIAFRESEVQLLFPGPLTRWQILMLKWIAAQFGAVIGGLLIGLMFQRFGNFSYPYVVLGFILNQTVLHANATLTGLLLAQWKVKGGIRARLMRAPAWGLTLVIGTSLALGWRQIGGVESWTDAKLLLGTSWVDGALLPFTALANVMMTTDPAAFALAAIYPVALIAVQAFVIWRVDFRFEDEAVEIAQKIQNIRKEGIGALRDKKELVVAQPNSPWDLSPTGPAWRALVWKNLISLGRFPRRTWIRMLIIVVVMVAVFSSVLIEDGHAATRIGFLILGLLFYGSILAPSFVRVDLRIDIPHFDVLKAMPLRGRSLIFGEVMGTVVALWAVQIIGCLIATFLITREGDYVFGWGQKIPGFFALVCGCFALDFAWVTAENLIALWFPGFVQLGRGIRAGFDQIGQNLMGALIRMLGLLVLFVVPALLGGLLSFGLYEFGVEIALAVSVGVVLASALLFSESYALIYLSDARYDRFDITSENITESD